MKIDVIFLKSDVEFSASERKLIKRILVTHATRAARALKFAPRVLTFTIYPAWPRTDREGMPAYTQVKDWIWIAVNLQQFRSIKHHKRMLERLIYLAYHETHHAARDYAGFLPGKQEHVLMKSIVSEGLADTFALEQYPSAYVRRKVTYDKKEVERWLPRVRKIQWTSDYPESWLFGGYGKPKSLAYNMGRYIIERVKKNNPNLNATKLLHTDAKRILKLSGIK